MEMKRRTLMIEIDNRQNAFPVDSQMEELIKRAVDQVLSYESFTNKAEVDIMLTDNSGIRELNREYRSIDSATDVLSFPMLDYEEGYEEDGDVEVGVEDLNPESGEVVLGDIVISLERAKEQSEEYGHSLNREVAFLVVHSMLHLLGYDHIQESDRVIMRGKEEDILEEMGLAR